MKRKYNLSAIMKRAWEIVKTSHVTMSDALKQAWTEAKTINANIKMCIVGKETITINTVTGEVSGKTYNAKDFLKDNFSARWDKDAKKWIVDVDRLKTELTAYAGYYAKYIVEDTEATTTKVKTIADQQLVNGRDGFYSIVTYTDGTRERVFIG